MTSSAQSRRTSPQRPSPHYFTLLLCCLSLSMAQAQASDAYADLHGLRVAGNADKTRLVLDAGKIGGFKVEHQPQSSRVVLNLQPVSRQQSSEQLRPWLDKLKSQAWVQSVRSGWNSQSGVFTVLISSPALSDAKAFVLSAESIGARERLVIDFEHPGAGGSRHNPSGLATTTPQPGQGAATILTTTTTPTTTATPPPGTTTAAIATATPQPGQGAANRPDLDALVQRLMSDDRVVDHAVKRTPATATFQNRAAPPSSKRGRKLVIVIDAGHGGRDPGALGRKKHHEKYYTLRYAKEIAAAIDQRAGMRAVLTRNKDEYIALPKRMRMATEAKADLFISVHADSFPKAHAKGSSVYALSLAGATSKTAQLMADDANNTLGFGGLQISAHNPMVAATLVDLAQTASIEKSLDFGKILLGKVSRFQTLHSSTVQQANFFVLRTPEYPAVLLELAFISNPQDERKLASKTFRRNIVQSIVGSIEKFFRLNPPAGSYFASQR